MANWLPEGFHSVTPYLIIDGAAAAIDFYRDAFGASEIMRLPIEDKIAHAEVRIGDSPIMLADEFPQMNKLGPKQRGGVTASLMIYVEDVDKVFAQAIAAGAEQLSAVEDQFYGDRSGSLRDPFGHEWTLATHVEDLSEEEIERRMADMMS